MEERTELLTHKRLSTIVELQKLAMSMTMADFIERIKDEYNYRDNGRYIDFDCHDLTATICIDSRTLSGVFDIWDKEGAWCDTFSCQSVSFKE